jgi:uncharacterized protein
MKQTFLAISIHALLLTLGVAAPAHGAFGSRAAVASAPVSTEVVFVNERAGVRLAGTLTLPASGAPHPAVVLVTGSGPQDRDETIMSHKPFGAIAEHLARRGFAVLRYDDRGIGASTGDFFSATTEDFAGDTAAAVAFLERRPEVNPKRIGILGHSEGASVAALVAASNHDIAFVVLLGGPGLRGEDLLELQGKRLQRASGLPDSAVAAAGRLQQLIFGVVRSEPDPAAGAARLRSELSAAVAAMAPSDRSATGLTLELVEAQVRQLQAGYRWMRFFLTYDPASSLRLVRCPVLALGGALDLQVPAAENLAAIERALRSSGNENVTTVTLPRHNHLFQTCETGLPAEYASIDHSISEAALRSISDWLEAVRAR